MTNFTIKNIPDEIYEALKRRAAEHQRSINQEAIFCLRMELSRSRRTRAEAEALLNKIDQTRP